MSGDGRFRRACRSKAPVYIAAVHLRRACEVRAGQALPGQAERGIRELRHAIRIEALATISSRKRGTDVPFGYSLVTRDMKKPT